MVYFDQIWHTYACQHCRTTAWHANGQVFTELQSIKSWSVSENAHNFLTIDMVYLDQILQTYLFENCPATHPLCIHNSDEALRSIISADKGHLVKMLITLKPHVIF